MSEDASVIITGASRGIGKAITLSVAEHAKTIGVRNIVLIARDEDKLNEVAALAEQKNTAVELLVRKLDLEQVDLIPNFVMNNSTLLTERVILINNAGYTLPASLLETDNQNLLRTFSVNVFAPIIMVRELLRARVRLNTVVNIASTAGMSARPGWLSYASSKAAIINASLTMYEELLPYGIQVYCISPGRCATDLRATLVPDEDQSKIMQPEEVASIVTTVISTNSQAIAGQNILVRRQSHT